MATNIAYLSDLVFAFIVRKKLIESLTAGA